MANIKVSQMTEATSFDDGDYTMIVQANQNKKISKENIFSDLKEEIDTNTSNISNINTNIGNLSNLETVDTTNLVNSINSLTPKILWTNSNPTSSFPAQQITLSSDDYDVLEIFYYDWTSTKRMRSVKATKGEWISLDMMFRYYVKAYMGVRQIEPLSDTSLNIETCYSLVDNGSFAYEEYTNWCVPVYIVGYQTGLFNNEGE